MSNYQEFVEIINDMRHRGRTVWDRKQSLKEQYSQYGAHSVEFYVTKLFKNNGQPMNLNVKIVSEEGDVIKNEEGKVLFNKSKYIERCSEEYMRSLYNMLG